MERKIIISALFAAAIAVAGCSTGTLSPEQQAIVDAIQQNNKQVENITFSLLEKIDSTSLGEELDRRINLFETKIEVETGFIDKYGRQGMQVNRQRHVQERKQARTILKGIKELAGSLEDSRDSIIYRTYRFSCKGSFTDGTGFRCDGNYINITSDGKAYNMSRKNERHMNMGFTIPGYSDLLGSVEE